MSTSRCRPIAFLYLTSSGTTRHSTSYISSTVPWRWWLDSSASSSPGDSPQPEDTRRTRLRGIAACVTTTPRSTLSVWPSSGRLSSGGRRLRAIRPAVPLNLNTQRTRTVASRRSHPHGPRRADFRQTLAAAECQGAAEHRQLPDEPDRQFGLRYRLRVRMHGADAEPIDLWHRSAAGLTPASARRWPG